MNKRKRGKCYSYVFIQVQSIEESIGLQLIDKAVNNNLQFVPVSFDDDIMPLVVVKETTSSDLCHASHCLC